MTPTTALNRSVVVVDDEPHYAALMAKWLAADGWEVAAAGDVAGGFEAVASLEPWLLVLDSRLAGGAPGWALLQRLLDELPRGRRLPHVIVLTSRADERGEHTVSLEAQDLPEYFLTKPFNPQELHAYAARLRARAEHGREPGRGRQARMNARVLVVDDDAEAARSRALLLEGYGYDLQTPTDGRGALRLVAEYAFPPWVLVVGESLPDMSGLDLALAVRREEPYGPPGIVLLVGDGAAPSPYNVNASTFLPAAAAPWELVSAVVRLSNGLGRRHEAAEWQAARARAAGG